MEPLSFINSATRMKILKKIAEGGMGAVYEALQYGAESFEKTVAIKTLLPNLTNNRRILELFFSEAKLVADLVHENIVQIYQLGRNENGYYIVMEFVNGIPLANLITYHRTLTIPFPKELAVFIASRIARGLAYAHKRRDRKGIPLGIVHRDVCPNNIMITTEGLPKLGDFGVAQVAKSNLRGSRFLVGKRLFMAPEQANKQDVDFRADIFSLGAVLFEMLCFKTVRTSRAVQVDDISRVAEIPIPWQHLPEDLPLPLLNILRRMLALNRNERYQDTDDLAHDLEYFIYKHGYGPTIQTLEAYMRKHFAYLYEFDTDRNDFVDNTTTAMPSPPVIDLSRKTRAENP